MSAAVVFLDTETTGLTLDDDIWEIAAIRRDPDGTETELHQFVEHDEGLCEQLPERFLVDHRERYRASIAVTPQEMLDAFADLIRGDRPHIVGAVPNFDTERIAKAYRDWHQDVPAWHYHLIDVENLAVGYLAGRGGVLDCQPPWNSDVIARLVGVTIDEAERHTAMGDVRWAMRIYDAVMAGVR